MSSPRDRDEGKCYRMLRRTEGLYTISEEINFSIDTDNEPFPPKLLDRTRKTVVEQTKNRAGFALGKRNQRGSHGCATDGSV